MTPIPLKRAKRLKMGYTLPPRETPIVRAIIEALNSLDHVQCWRNNTGALRDETGRLVTYGLAVGSADIIGMVQLRRPVHGLGGEVLGWCVDGFSDMGRFVALEVKVPGKKPTVEQKRFGKIVRRRGGFACVVTSVDEALAAVARAERGERE